MVQIEDAFKTEGSSVYTHFQRPGVGFYIPLYQREYSWDVLNVKQLIDDIARGVEILCEEDNEIRFLGTIITVREKDLSRIDPQDTKGLPQTVEIIIDGQQRLSTLALFASQLYLEILNYESKLKSTGKYLTDIEEVCRFWKRKIQAVFSFDLEVGNHSIKPKIIRGQADKWIKEGDIDEAYTSPVAHYIAEFISFAEKCKADDVFSNPPALPKNKVGKSIREINKWLNRIVAKAHLDDSEFPSAKELIGKINQNYLWNHKRDHLKAVINDSNVSKSSSAESYLCSLVQLFSVAYYVLERCCFTVIRPVDDKWAFDMFQSLNATGTPLTAIETFKPLIVNTVEKIEKKDFKGSVNNFYFSKVENLFSKTQTASEKNKLTTDFITSFALISDSDNEAQKLPSYFSAQRGWLTRIYSEKIASQSSSPGELVYRQHEFVKYIGEYADFYKNLWIDYPSTSTSVLPLLMGYKDAEIASVILMYLKESNHRMALSVLSQFYISIADSKEAQKPLRINEFIDAIKAVGGFYTLWRSAQSNSRLDAKYRSLFKGTDGFPTFAWLQRQDRLTAIVLKQYLRQVLQEEGLLDKGIWMRKASNFLRYKSRTISKFLLSVYAHDTIEDKNHVGLAMLGVPNSNNNLKVTNWISPDLATLEHVAPVGAKPSDGWDEAIYEGDTVNTIGNLVLLPANINTSASNRGWEEKLVYYKHIGENDPVILSELAAKAAQQGILLAENPNTLKILRAVTHQQHMSIITSMESRQTWDRSFIESRTERILDICWERLVRLLD